MRSDSNRLIKSMFLSTGDLNLQSGWLPPVDIYQFADGFLVKADLAGVRPEDIQIVMKGCNLLIKGLRRDCNFEKGFSHILLEITYNHFERCISLPVNLERMKITTENDHGMLLIRIQKEAEES